MQRILSGVLQITKHANHFTNSLCLVHALFYEACYLIPKLDVVIQNPVARNYLSALEFLTLIDKQQRMRNSKTQLAQIIIWFLFIVGLFSASARVGTRYALSRKLKLDDKVIFVGLVRPNRLYKDWGGLPYSDPLFCSIRCYLSCGCKRFRQVHSRII